MNSNEHLDGDFEEPSNGMSREMRLLRCTALGHVQCFEHLDELAADWTTTSWSPLHVASMEGSVDVLKVGSYSLWARVSHFSKRLLFTNKGGVRLSISMMREATLL